MAPVSITPGSWPAAGDADPPIPGMPLIPAVDPPMLIDGLGEALPIPDMPLIPADMPLMLIEGLGEAFPMPGMLPMPCFRVARTWSGVAVTPPMLTPSIQSSSTIVQSWS